MSEDPLPLFLTGFDAPSEPPPPIEAVVDVEPASVEMVVPAPTAEPILGRGQMFLGDMFSQDDLEQMRAAQVFQKVDLDIETQYRCPVCCYEWSGNPKPMVSDQEAEMDA